MSLRISNSELEVLNVLWGSDTPLHRGGILEHSKDKTWKDSYIHILLNKMLEKGLIKEAGFTRSGKVWARLYAPAISQEEYYADALLAGGFDPATMVKLILKKSDSGKETLDALQNVIDQARTEEEKKDV